jgi:hypothetical protein
MLCKQALAVDKSIWIRSGFNDGQYILRPLKAALLERGVTVLTLNNPCDAEGLERIRRMVWNSDAHVILDAMAPVELGRLYSIFKDRKNFSMAFLDWWVSPHWFTRNADYLIFRFYNGIAVRHKLASFVKGCRPPLFSLPQSTASYELATVALRLPALLIAPFLQLLKRKQKHLEGLSQKPLLYFPNMITEEQVPLRSEAPDFDFSNISWTGGGWLMRDPHASAWLNFGNLYCDRKRITDLILKSGDGAYKVFDLRRTRYLNWDDYCQVVRKSRYAIATGGLHKASLSKYLEFACVGTPILGEDVPFEFPWLKQCLFPVDTLNVTPEELAVQLREALARQSQLRENCLNIRETLLKLYHPHRILDLLQEQADGKTIPPGYLKIETDNNATWEAKLVEPCNPSR